MELEYTNRVVLDKKCPRCNRISFWYIYYTLLPEGKSRVRLKCSRCNRFIAEGGYLTEHVQDEKVQPQIALQLWRKAVEEKCKLESYVKDKERK